MKRCNACSRYAVGQPTYCPFCGRSYDVRICSRGHRCPRSVQFCPECGSEDLSTPAPPENLLTRLSRWALRLILLIILFVTFLLLIAVLLSAVDSGIILQPLLLLLLMYAFFRWTSTLIPGPVKKVGRAVGRQAVKAMKKLRQR